MQADIQLIYEVHHAIGSRRMLSLLSHGPYSCPFGLCYTHYFTIISLLYVLFQNQKLHLVAYSLHKTCQSAHPPQGLVSIQTRSIWDSIINLQQALSHAVIFRNRPIQIGLSPVRQPCSTQSMLEISTQ